MIVGMHIGGRKR